MNTLTPPPNIYPPVPLAPPPPKPRQGAQAKFPSLQFPPPPPSLPPTSSTLRQGSSYEWPLEELKKAAVNGDVMYMRFLEKSNTPIHYYFTIFQISHRMPRHYGNIFHLAVSENNVEFIKEVIKLLPAEAIQYLLLQPRSNNNKENPLHMAASLDQLAIVKLFLDVFNSSPALSQHGKPWLAEIRRGVTPCYMALIKGHQECMLEILNMDIELLSNMVDDQDCGLLFLAIYYGLKHVALAILKSQISFSCSGYYGLNPLHIVTYCSGDSEKQEIFDLLVEKKPNLVQEYSRRKWSILHYWAQEGIEWPFKCLLKKGDELENIREDVVKLMSATEEGDGGNPFHVLAALAPVEEDAVEIAKLLIKTYQQHVATEAASFPWLMKNKCGATPLFLSISRGFEKLAMHILSVDNVVSHYVESEGEALSLAINKGFQKVADKILDTVDIGRWNKLTNHRQLNALQLAPKAPKEPNCKVHILQRLLEGNPLLLKEVNKSGWTTLHAWMEIGKVWPFKELLKRLDSDLNLRSDFISQISKVDNNGNNPFHLASTFYRDETDEIVQLLIDAYMEANPNWHFISPIVLPWFIKNKCNDSPLLLAIQRQQESLALKMLSAYVFDDYRQLLNYYAPDHNFLFLTIERKCYNVAKIILTRLHKGSWKQHLIDAAGRTVLHLAPHCTDKQAFGKWLVEKAPELMSKKDKNGITPLAEACIVGADWIIGKMLEKNRSWYRSDPLVWTKACENGHISTCLAFGKWYPRFKTHCLEKKTSPWHHIDLSKRKDEHGDELMDPTLQELINVKDSKGVTPLHKAIRSKDIVLTETLLNMNNILSDIPDAENDTARELLKNKSYQSNDWKLMCDRVGYDPKCTKARTTILELRNTLLVVATLLATITFTAGFTVPGGFNQSTGEAILAKEAAFLVFVISDALAMCSSLLVLIYLILRMVYETSKLLVIINRCIIFLTISLYSTLSAFMSGVYVVTPHKSLWAAIVIILLCSFLGIACFKYIRRFVISIQTRKDRIY